MAIPAEQKTVSIRTLPLHIQRQIAAGEVVERPASVVKELVENAIDAGAQAISVEILDAGLGLIRVADDGCGMSRTDASRCLERFSTSKVYTEQDLQAIETLGFRGEALSSILAAARVEILTRAADELEGTRIQATDQDTQIWPAASPVGTSVTVRGLYAHLPARRRFLKSHTRETELVQRTVSAYALAYPDIAFRLSANDQERLIAPKSTALARIGTVLGREVAGEMIPIDWQALDLQVRGFTSRPTIARSRRSGQYFFVNGRPIQPGLLAVMLERPYSGRLVAGRHPLAVIQIHTDPHYVDANVHPQKTQVRFAHERTVYSALSSAVAHALHEYPRTETDQSTIWPFWDQTNSIGSAISEASEGYVPHALRALAQLHGTYILAQTYDGLAIADQHAAHEQVLFERLEQTGEICTLTPPVQIELSLREAQILEEIETVFLDLGIEVDPFGNGAYLIRSLPSTLSRQDPVELINGLIQEAASFRDRGDLLHDRLASKAACMGAVKAGDPLTAEQMQWLLDELGETWSPSNCPHGRPVLVTISLQELARRFDRHTG